MGMELRRINPEFMLNQQMDLLNDPWPKTELAKAQLTALMGTEPNEK